MEAVASDKWPEQKGGGHQTKEVFAYYRLLITHH
jgi:hypothetical protein